MRIKVILAISAIMLGWLWWRLLPSDKVKVIFCDVGQGDGAIIEVGYSQMLIDVGNANGKMVKCLGDHIPLGDKQIEMVLISHWDEDHAGGLRQVLEYYRVDKILSGTEPNGQIEQNNYSGNLASGDVVSMGSIKFEVKSPDAYSQSQIPGDNSNSVVGVLSYGLHTILFSGDMTEEVDQRLVWRKIITEPVEILKVSHHGSAGATSEELLSVIKPETAIISVGKNNKFGHPTREVLERLQKWSGRVRSTDEEGDIELGWDSEIK